MTLTEMLTRSVESSATSIALSDDTRTVTYAELGERVGDVAAALVARRVRPGDRVALAVPNVVEFAYLYHGIAWAGGVVVPLNPVLRVAELRRLLDDCDPVLLVAWAGVPALTEAGDAAAAGEALGVEVVVLDAATFPEFAPSHPDAPLVPRRGDDLAVLLYTSGTTGEPKGAMLTHDNLVVNAEVDRDLVDMGPDDVVLGALPLFHAFGQTCCLNLPLLAGSHVVLHPVFNPRHTLASVGEKGITVFLAVPAMYTALLHFLARSPEDYDLSTLRMTISSGAPLAVELLHRVEERFGVLVLEGYGLSETSPTATLNVEGRCRPGTVGTPLPGVEVRVVDQETGEPVEIGAVGEVAIRGHNVMRGYWNAPEATAAVLSPDGWLRTGDLGTLDDDGFLTIVDRKKDLVIVGGENVYPREVEEVFYAHPAVAECAVLGVPDPVRGEVVGAAVVLAEGADADEAELRAHVRAHLSGAKVPRHVWFVEGLPKGGTNKILKRAITLPESLRPHLD
ncbi:long-chain-fatty-acid--CoA ligase [Mobilicoccus pelagius]|uniref:Long-chain fatty-acid--CoA ligase n=1 Tax=Mobilicoccus pelagius NBRC 104925 TaxID=1089455 RepID=H5URL4_9MICO|nr:long-chain fatty acid--CoA ligase [Mobilicoccus pelagius]GAB48372.1 long-chain fatty-acid--CoA ligase [Mobilicoccus pelagius NBRC 104925]